MLRGISGGPQERMFKDMLKGEFQVPGDDNQEKRLSSRLPFSYSCIVSFITSHERLSYRAALPMVETEMLSLGVSYGLILLFMAPSNCGQKGSFRCTKPRARLSEMALEP